MKFESLNGLGFKGINTDLAPWELPYEFITDGANFRVDGNRIVSAGASRVIATPGNDPQGGHLVPVHTPSGDFFLILGGGSGNWRCQSWDGTAFADISSAPGAYVGISAPENWTSCLLGKIPIVNNRQHFPEYWNPQTGGTDLQALLFDQGPTTFAAANIQFRTIRSFKNILFALNLTEGGVAIPNGYRWSHPAPVNDLPPSWDETDTAFIAGKAQIGGDVGAIIDGRTLRSGFAIYSEFGVTVLYESGDEFVWDPKPLSDSYGVLNDKCIQEVKGVHFFLSDGDIIKNDGNRLTSAVHNVILKRLRSQLSADYFDRSFSIRDTVKKELWFCVAEGSAQFPNVAYIYNWAENKWSIQDLPYTFVDPNVTENTIHAAFGIVGVAQLLWSSFTTETWADSGLSWAGNTASPLSTKILGLDGTDGSLVELDPIGGTGQQTDFFIERSDIALEGHEWVTTITRVFPYIDSPNPVEIRIGHQEGAGKGIFWDDTVTFDPTTDRYIDVRSTGPLHAYRVSSIGTGGCSISGMSCEYELDGRRGHGP